MVLDMATHSYTNLYICSLLIRSSRLSFISFWSWGVECKRSLIWFAMANANYRQT